MYGSEPLFPYIAGRYAIMPPGLPDRFYPIEESRVHRTDEYVICFNKDVSEEEKLRLIKDYAEYHAKEKASGIFR